MKRFMIALVAGGLMEDPKIRYTDLMGIYAETKEKAIEIYKETHRCDFYRAECIGEVIDGMINLPEAIVTSISN